MAYVSLVCKQTGIKLDLWIPKPAISHCPITLKFTQLEKDLKLLLRIKKIKFRANAKGPQNIKHKYNS